MFVSKRTGIYIYVYIFFVFNYKQTFLYHNMLLLMMMILYKAIYLVFLTFDVSQTNVWEDAKEYQKKKNKKSL